MRLTRMLSMLLMVFCLCTAVTPLSVSAHFLIDDAKSGVTAQFHVTPDHDPVAGQNSVISYDFSKGQAKVTDYSYVLTVKGTRTERVTVPTAIEGNVVLANYTFPQQGVYSIRLQATSRGAERANSTLQYTQRVSKGLQNEDSPELKPWELAIIAGTLGIAIGAVLYVSLYTTKPRRKP